MRFGDPAVHLLRRTDLLIGPGGHRDENIAAELNRADVILLPVNADFLAAKYINRIELATALEREKRGQAVVIRVILRFADWTNTPFHALQALPPNAKPVADWPNRDEAYLEVAKGVQRVVKRLSKLGHAEPGPQADASKQDSGTPPPPGSGPAARSAAMLTILLIPRYSHLH